MGLDKVIAVTPFHGRPKVSKIFLEQCKEIGLNLVAVCHLGDDENAELCQQYTDHVVIAHQNITGKKWNQGLRYAANLDWEYLIVLGSDDLISLRYFEDFAYKKMNEGVKYIGLIDAIAIDLKSKKGRYWPGYTNERMGEPLGCGRLIHRDIIKHYRYMLFPEILRGSIDRYSHELIKRQRPTEAFMKSALKPYRIGLKGGEDITKELDGCPFVYNIRLKDYYSDNIIKQIRNWK